MRLPTRSSVTFWGFLVGLAALTLVRLDLLSRHPQMSAADAQSLPGADHPALDPAGPGTAAVHLDTLGGDGSVYLSLKALGVPDGQIHLLGRALAGVFDPQRESHAGDAFRLELDDLGAIQRFEYTPLREPERPVWVELRGDQLVGMRLARPLTKETTAVEIEIEDNLSNAIASAGEGDALTDMVLDLIFGSVIDFHKDPRRGDRLGLVFTKLYMDDHFVRYGRVLLARYDGQVVSHMGVFFQQDPSSPGDFYDEDGNSLERLFLLKPMEFRRISSGFSRSRFHPILKRNIPHLGTDYAAARGTAVWSTAQGRVTFAGWNGGYGRMVEVEHANGYRTRYAHLSRIQVRKGERVSQRQFVGQVGATGRATGPHLHYEVIHNGRQVDPSGVNRSARRRTLEAGSRSAFIAHRDRLLELLDGSGQPAGEPIVADRATSPWR